MDPTVRRTIDELVTAAERHDATRPNRLDRWRVLEPDAGRLVWFLAQAIGARSIVEIGTSRGVSTLWLADAARATGGAGLAPGPRRGAPGGPRRRGGRGRRAPPLALPRR